jgi:hypothetical protein
MRDGGFVSKTRREFLQLPASTGALATMARRSTWFGDCTSATVSSSQLGTVAGFRGLVDAG